MGKGKRRQRRVFALPDRAELAKEEVQARNAKAMASEIRAMEKKIRDYHTKHYPEKPLDYILVKIRGQYGIYGEFIAIKMIKRDQWRRLSFSRQMDVEKARIVLLQQRPDLKEQMEPDDCPANPNPER
jgi:hypothetical protein